ncbi:MAG: type II secretion system minor pseudopilin GspJ [Pseudomonadota bacterium]
MTRVSPDSGFSLIETLVALFVIALVSTAGGAMLLDTMRASARVDASASDIRRLEVATGLLRADLAAMTSRASTGPDSYLPPRGPIGNDGARDGPVLAFVRGGWSDFTSQDSLRSDLMRIEYVREGELLLRRAYGAPDPTVRTPMAQRPIYEGISDISLRYGRGGSWSNTWETPASVSDPELPDLIEITVTFSDQRIVRQVFLAGGAAKG